MLFNTFRRLRHSRGFGIHSPSAYSFVRDTLCPARGYAYYSYWSIPTRVATLNGRLILRVIAALQPATITVAGTDSHCRAVAAIAAYACPSARVTRHVPGATEACDMLVCCDRSTDVPPQWRHGLFSSRRNTALKARIASATTGHLFRGRRAAIFADSGAPFQIIDISL